MRIGHCFQRICINKLRYVLFCCRRLLHAIPNERQNGTKPDSFNTPELVLLRSLFVLEGTKWTSSNRHLSISIVIIWGHTLHVKSHSISLQTIFNVNHKFSTIFYLFKKIEMNDIWSMYMNQRTKSGHVQLQGKCDKQCVDKLQCIDLEQGVFPLPPFSESTATHASRLYHYISSCITRIPTVLVCK